MGHKTKKYIIITIISLLVLSGIIVFANYRSKQAGQPDSGQLPGEEAGNPLLTDPVGQRKGEGEGNPDTHPTPLLPEIDHEAYLPPFPGMARSRITNEWVSAETKATRPVAIVVPNSRTASQYGLSKASILYEVNVEGSMTRLMAVWEDWSNLDKIGNIRSIRDYFAYWAFEWDAFFIHFGGPFYADGILNRDSTHNIDCLRYSGAYFRDTAKNTVDNAFTNTETILSSLDHFGYSLDYRPGITDEPHFSFADPGSPNDLSQYLNAAVANNIDMSSAYPVTNCYFVFNAETGLYERFQHLSGENDGPHLDLMNGEQLTFKNVIIQYTYFEQRDQQGYLAFQCHDTTRGGWFFTNGKGIRINWQKTGDYDPTRYFDENGNEIELNMGKTMILIVQDGDSFILDGRRGS
ncbi:MAG: DUF3048 domain-containing protein [Lachnospiraceae bacterium]|nr:DUF3048 domain-containing protein [Lachnospiraceae bacterium]